MLSIMNKERKGRREWINNMSKSQAVGKGVVALAMLANLLAVPSLTKSNLSLVTP